VKENPSFCCMTIRKVTFSTKLKIEKTNEKKNREYQAYCKNWSDFLPPRNHHLAEIGVQLQQCGRPCVAGADLHADATATDFAEAELHVADAAAGAELPEAAAAAVAVAGAAVGVPRSQAGPANLRSSVAEVDVGSAAAGPSPGVHRQAAAD